MGVEGMEHEDDELREAPDEIGPTPRWFIIGFSLMVLACGVASCVGAVGVIAGWWWR